MTSGGSRIRSGRAPDRASETGRRFYANLAALPAAGYTGRVPAWPLPTPTSKTERALWREAWRTPQAAAWARPEFGWLRLSIAMWVRTLAVCESGEATAADKATLHRFADQIGMTQAGLRLLGWKVQPSETRAPTGPGNVVAELLSPKPHQAAVTDIRDRL